MIAAASLGAVAGFGGEERLSPEEFSDRLQTIDRRGSELWGRLAQRAALRERTETFEQVIEAARFTRQNFDQVTQSGEKIDQAFVQLREEGFLPTADEHDEEE